MKNVKDQAPCLGVIYGNRDFFPDKLVTEARADIAKIFKKYEIRSIQLDETDSKVGGVETHADARKCAALLRNMRMKLMASLSACQNLAMKKASPTH